MRASSVGERIKFEGSTMGDFSLLTTSCMSRRAILEILKKQMEEKIEKFRRYVDFEERTRKEEVDSVLK